VTKLIQFNTETHTVGLDQDLAAALVPARPDPPVPVNGFTFGVATMSESAPHGGEMHPDGDEILYLISGCARVILESDPVEELVIEAGAGLVVPRGVWHRVEILEPCRIVYLTPGPNNEFRTLEADA
jgi:mannose-6-phosphate isomerase-like protein (cupin superfamily)